MTPDSRVWRKAARKALRGVPTGRRATHQVVTRNGRHQRQRDHEAIMSAFFAETKAAS